MTDGPPGGSSSCCTALQQWNFHMRLQVACERSEYYPLTLQHHYCCPAGNQYKKEMPRYKLPHILSGLVRGLKCFDVDYFISRNPDMRPHAANPNVIWRFFVYMGQFEDRAYRYNCDLDYDKFGRPVVHPGKEPL